MDLFKKCDYERLKQVREKGIYPWFHVLESRQAPVVQMEGKRMIMLGSNNYLGLAEDERVIAAGHEALEKYGSGVSGSRFLNGTLDLHLQLEHALAEFTGYEDAMTCSTGFQTNLAIISAICGKDDYILSDRENHASIYDACRLTFAKMLRYRHSDMNDLERQLQSVPDDAGKLIVTDGVFSMRGDICCLPEICALAKKYGARVMVDDAHGLGVIGPGGRGTAHHFGLASEVDILMGTFSKSLASLGGYVAASRTVVDFLRHASAPFIFSASIPPASAAVALAALRHLRRHPELPTHLREVSDYARKVFVQHGIPLKPGAETNLAPILPIVIGGTQETLVVAKRAYEGGVFTNPFIPPGVPEGGGLLRTSVTATHTPALIDEAAGILAEALKC